MLMPGKLRKTLQGGAYRVPRPDIGEKGGLGYPDAALPFFDSPVFSFFAAGVDSVVSFLSVDDELGRIVRFEIDYDADGIDDNIPIARAVAFHS